jgi:LmbE family N-acetylglucosaminyl deacetylase
VRGWFAYAATLLVATAAAAAEETAMNAATLAHALDRLANTGRVLYVAAHPDDENTRLLAYLANQRHVDATYLSMTRGGGGQNLIGAEQDALLDVIRTEELLSARRLDGAGQRFTRMRDFGFSKTADETLRIWDHDQALADVVWVIRTVRPDVVITRFDELPPNHGHHTASAILAREAFAGAADPQRFPEQFARGATPWQAERLLLNVPTWREGPPPDGALALDVSAYDPRLGLSSGELAARSRSQHKSQGFGVAGERGEILERFVPLAGTAPKADILDGIQLGWSRYGEPGVALDAALSEARGALERDHPERALPALIRVKRGLAALDAASEPTPPRPGADGAAPSSRPPGSEGTPPANDPRLVQARRAVDEIIAAAAGVFVRASADRPGAVPGSSVAVRVEVILRRPAPLRLRAIELPGVPAAVVDAALGVNHKTEVTRDVPIPADTPISAPYWLALPPEGGRHTVADLRLVGEPKGPPALAAAVELQLDGASVRLTVPVVYAWTDQVQGERERLFLIVPPATVTPARQAVLFPNGQPAAVMIRVRAAVDDLRGDVILALPAGWRAEPARVPVSLARAGDETAVRVVVTPPPGAAAAEVAPAIEIGGRAWSVREDVIDYPHIPMQVVLQPAALRLVPLTLALPPGPIGYIPGSGDTVADDLAHVGFTVQVLDDETLRSGDLSRYAAIVVGIRAYNTRVALRGGGHERLMRYVEGGGTLVVQYNVNNRFSPLGDAIGPFPFTIGRDRITDETAAMEAVDPASPLLQTPNRIEPADFDGWVQERGLYYAATWDDRYLPVFRSADPGEPPLLGGMLVARHGRGRYIYTGLSFFRQLPAGVPGAYRLFANLLAPEPSDK